MSRRGDAGPAANVAKVVTLESTQRQVAVYNPSDPNEVREDPPIPNESRERAARRVAPTSPRAPRIDASPLTRRAQTPIQTPTRRVRRVTR